MFEKLQSLLIVLVGIGMLAAVGLVVVGNGDGEFQDERRVRIDARKAEVFATVFEPERRAEWVSDLVRTSPTSLQRAQAGTRFEETLATPEGEVQRTVEILELRPAEVVEYRTSMEGASVDVRYEVASHFTGSQTLLTVTYDCRWEGRWEKLIEPVLSSRVRARFEEELTRLEEIAERRTP